jgi:hypothetical protein
MYFKYTDYLELYKASKKIQRDDGLFDTDLYKYLFLEILFTVLHPNLLFKDKEFITNKSWNIIESHLYVNDLLLVMNLLRFYLILQALIALSHFYSGRSDRIR